MRCPRDRTFEILPTNFPESDLVWSSKKNSEMQARLAALDRAQAVIEFDLAGNVLTANQNFLTTLGYLPIVLGALVADRVVHF